MDMMVTKEAVEKRLMAMTDRRDKMIAEVNALIGSIREMEHWLAVLEKEPAAETMVKETAAAWKAD